MEVTESQLFELLGRLYVENAMLRRSLMERVQQNGTSEEPIPEEVASSLTT